MDAEGKTNAFRLYGFENNQEWKNYLLRVDISGPGYNDKLLKLKAKWYKREVDSDFELEWLKKYGMTSAQQSSPAETSESTEGTSAAAGTSYTAGASSDARPASVPRGSASLSLTLMHAAIFLFGVMSMLPLSSRALHTAYLQVFVVTCFSKVLLQFGFPKFRPLSELKLWAARAFNTTDAQYGLMGLLFIRHVHTKIIFLPGIVLAAYHVMHYLSIRLAGRALWIRYGVPVYNRLSAQRNAALLLNAIAEIMTGLLLILQLLIPSRNFIVLVLYWQWLRIRYWSPDSAWMHQQAWSNIGRKVDPLLNRVPFVNVPIRFIKQWFQAGHAR